MPETAAAETPTAGTPAEPAASLRGFVLRVANPAADASFYQDTFGLTPEPGPQPGWIRVDTGWGQSLFLAPGGGELPVIGDRWEHQGFIPILRTFRVEELTERLDGRGVHWINRPFGYEMRGHALLGYFADPAGQPIGIQQRMSDSVREEDLATLERLAAEAGARKAENGADGAAAYPTGPDAPEVLGIGWVIHQAADIVAAREFYASALGWPMVRGTDGFGYMMTVDPVTILQIAFRGRAKDPGRDLSAEPQLPLLRGDADEIIASVERHGGREVPAFAGLRAFTDPEGHAWLIDSAGTW